MNNTDSSGELYPFRELYMDGIVGDWWIRLGKQQIVWGKTDFFRLQDVLNPVDFGQHFFFGLVRRYPHTTMDVIPSVQGRHAWPSY